MKRLAFVAFFFSCCAFAMGQNNCTMGLVYDRNAHYSTPLANVDSLMQSANSDNSQQVLASQCYLTTPPALSQGGQPSCTGWAVGYAAASILVYQKYGDWTLSTMSPSFVYNQAKLSSDCSRGASFCNAFNLVRDKGICTIESMSYDASSCSSLPNASILRHAAYNTMSYGRVNEKSVTNICSLLSKGYPIVVGVYVTSSFYSMWYSDGIWRNDERSNNDGYHACCVVGYDNVSRMFKVQNSWGSRGGDNGFFWVTYDLVNNGVFNEAYVLYDLNPAVDISLQGPSQFCDTAVYTLANVPAGATVKWDFSPRSSAKMAFRIVRGQGTAQAVYKRGTVLTGVPVDTLGPIGGEIKALGRSITRPFSGSATVTATVTFNGRSHTVCKSVTLPPLKATEKPFVDGWNSSLWYVGVSHTLRVRNCDSVPDGKLVWEVYLPGQSAPMTHTGRSVTFTPKREGKVTVVVANMEGCSAANVDTLSARVIQRPVISYANPAPVSGSVDVFVASRTDGSATVSVPYDGAYTLELWSELYGRVRTVESCVPTAQIPLGGLNAGTYFIKLLIGGEPVTTEQLIIK